MEETTVQGVEDLVEIVVVAGGGRETLAATGLTNVLGLAGDGLRGDIAAVTVGVGWGDGLFVELGEEDVGDGVVDGVGGGLEQVGEADVEAAFAKADGGVEGGEAAEANVERRNGCAGAEIAVLIFEDGDEGGRCGGFCGALFGEAGTKGWTCGGFGDLVKESGGESGRRLGCGR
jgi:hypothetical protein